MQMTLKTSVMDEQYSIPTKRRRLDANFSSGSEDYQRSSFAWDDGASDEHVKDGDFAFSRSPDFEILPDGGFDMLTDPYFNLGCFDTFSAAPPSTDTLTFPPLPQDLPQISIQHNWDNADNWENLEPVAAAVVGEDGSHEISNYDAATTATLDSVTPAVSLLDPLPELDSTKIEASTTADQMDIDRPVITQEYQQCDTCFGTLEVLVKSSQELKKIKKGVPATISPFSQKTISVMASGSYIGMIEASKSQKLLKIMSLHQSLECEAFIPNAPLENTCLRISIDIYGSRGDIRAVGRSLSKEKLFLQDSPKNERKLAYENPHVLRISESAKVILELDAGSESKRVDIKIEKAVEQDDEISKIFDSESIEVLSSRKVTVSGRVATQLMQHQKQALGFMVAKEVPYVTDNIPNLWNSFKGAEGLRFYLNKIDKTTTETLPNTFRGGILADEMGLGKSLSILALIATSLDSSLDSSPRQPTLIITPKSTLFGWEDQINVHTRDLATLVYTSKRKEVPNFHLHDIVLTTFGVVTSEAGNGPISKFAWRRVVLDEAHTIRRRTTKQAQAIYKLDTERRWCLTGTPIQNELDDYGSLLEFLQVAPVNTKAAFRKHITRPLRAGEGEAFERLRHIVAATTIRRIKAKTLATLLPERIDEIHRLQFNEEESRLYDLLNQYTNSLIDQELKRVDVDSQKRGRSGIGRQITQLLLRLRQVCNHGGALLPTGLREDLSTFENGPGIANISFATCCELCSTHDDVALDEGAEMMDCDHLICKNCLVGDASTQQDICPLCSPSSPDIELEDASLTSEPSPYSPITPDLQPLSIAETSHKNIEIQPSTKVLALLQNLHDSRSEKSVVFSCWTKMLDLVAATLEKNGVLFERLDGSMNVAERKRRVESFRVDGQIRVLLASVGSGSVGIDLTAATRIHLLEPHFNPMAEEQALARVHRIGQTKPVVTVRYIIEGSYEERIQTLQQKKLKLAELCSGGLKSAQSSVETLKYLKEILR